MNALQPSRLWRNDTSVSSRVADMANSKDFKVGIVHAIAEYAQEVADRPDAGSRIAGARDFVAKLLNIGTEPKKTAVPKFNLPEE